MKKIFLILLCFILTGCGKQEDAKKILEEAGKKLDDTTHHSLQIEGNVEMLLAGAKVTLPMTLEVKIDEQNATTYSKRTVTLLGSKTVYETYHQKSSNQIVSYTKEPHSDLWAQSTKEGEYEDVSILYLIENASEIKKAYSAQKTIQHYELTIPSVYWKEWNRRISGKGTEEQTVIHIFVNKETNEITKMIIELKDILKLSNQNECLHARMEIAIEKNFYSSITIPEEVTKNKQKGTYPNYIS